MNIRLLQIFIGGLYLLYFYKNKFINNDHKEELLMTPRELKDKTVRDIQIRRKRRDEGKKQAINYSFENMNKVQKRCSSKLSRGGRINEI